jgi:hypothetical protein
MRGGVACAAMPQVTGQLIAELIDVNMITWLVFGVPPLIALIVTHAYESREVEKFHDNLDENLRELQVYGPLPNSVEVGLYITLGWLWLLMALGLELLMWYSTDQLRVLFGFDDTMQALKEANQIEKMAISELRVLAASTRGRAGGSSKALANEGGEMEGSKKGAGEGGGGERSEGGERHRVLSADGLPLTAAQEKANEWAVRTEVLTRTLMRQAKTAGNLLASPEERRSSGLMEASAAENGTFPDPRSTIWAARHLDTVKQLLQIIMLLSCGQVALYSLSLAYGIFASNVGDGMHFLALLPPSVTLFALLPHLCYTIALFEAYAVPNEPVLDAVISDLDSRNQDKVYLRSQLIHRLERAETGTCPYFSAISSHLDNFERHFDATHTLPARCRRAFVDLARGQALCFIDREACFLVGVLSILTVPMSRERLERLVPWFKSEVCPRRLSVAALFDNLGLEPPKCPQVQPCRTSGV